MKILSIQNQQGFSLIEAMIAMVILSVGLMAVGLMQIGAMKGNTNALGRSDGVAMAQSVMDTLRCLPLDDDALTDVDAANVNLDDGRSVGNNAPVAANAGHQSGELLPTDAITGTVTGANGQQYTIFWNVDEDTPVVGARTIRLFTYWNDQKFGRNRAIITSVLGGMYL